MPLTNVKKQEPQKILVIEDEGDMCLLLELLLNSKDMVVDHVKTLAGAEAYLKTEQPAVVVLDNRLPDGFGLDFIGFIKERYPAVKIIMISGVDAAAKDVALDNGADTFLAKPFTRQQLHDSIKGMVN